VAGAHRAHVARGIAGDASAGGNAELRRTITGGDARRRTRALGLHGEEFAAGITRDPDGHSRHIIGDVETMSALAGLHRAITGGFGLFRSGVGVKASAISGRGTRVLLKFLLNRIGGLCRIGRVRRACSVAGGEREKSDGDKTRGDFHVGEIVNGVSDRARVSQPFRHKT
jgi:hypothetical protein